MKAKISLFIFLMLTAYLDAQTNSYAISFNNAVHNKAELTATFPEIATDTLTVRMSRTSPGRNAFHEFAKNVDGFKATDSAGNPLKIIRTHPYAWQVVGHDGTVKISYTLFANRPEGTYSEVDESHAHLNIPATFMYAPELASRKVKVEFKVRKDLNWKIATQLPMVS